MQTITNNSIRAPISRKGEHQEFADKVHGSAAQAGTSDGLLERALSATRWTARHLDAQHGRVLRGCARNATRGLPGAAQDKRGVHGPQGRLTSPRNLTAPVPRRVLRAASVFFGAVSDIRGP